MPIHVKTERQGGHGTLFSRISCVKRAADYVCLVVLAVALAGCGDAMGNSGTPGAAVKSSRAVAQATPSKTVRQAQRLLTKRGFDPGPADGLMGRRTVQAIRDYQKAAGLTVNGKVTEHLIAHLESRKHAEHETLAAVAAGTPGAPARPAPRPVSDLFSADYGDIQPIYSPDDVFVWSSGAVDRVVRVGANSVVWRSSDGTNRTENRSFSAPAVAWQTDTAEGTSKIASDPPQIWPLAAGTEISFEVHNSTRKTGQDGFTESRETWRCKRAGEKTITVPAGRFETVIVSCTRAPGPKTGWRKRVWYYAPAVRHFVRRDSFDAAGRRLRIRLVVLRPGWKGWPPAARAGLNWAIQDTLSKGKKGIGVEWGSSGVGTKLTILPGVTFPASGNRRCRKYALIQTPPMAPRAYPAVACWDAKKEQWLVPGLDDGAAPIKAVR